jgi:integrase
MARRKNVGMIELPSGVHAVKAGGKVYYYWHPNRGTALEGKRVALGTDPRDPVFWEKLKAAQGKASGDVEPWTFAALALAYRGPEGGVGSVEWEKNYPSTKKVYNLCLDRIVDKWGHLPVASVTARDIYAFREMYADTPSLANKLVVVLRTLIAFGVPRGYIERNPVNDVQPLPLVDVEHARPWPEDAFQRVLKTAPESLRRAAFLGRVTGQRRSDLVLYGRKNRRADGLQVKIGKLRNKDHFIPLKASELAEIDSWSCSDTGPWITNAASLPMSGHALGDALDRFLAKVPELAGLNLNPHGWRAMAVCDRRLDGLSHQEISAQLCMSMNMVMRYSTHIDQERLAREANKKRT